MQQTTRQSVTIGELFDCKYRVMSELGAGGFGRVFAAENENLGTKVAIKVCHTRGHDERVWREARAAARLQSPHSVRVLDVDRLEDGTPYIVMERLEGMTLRAYLDAHGRVPALQAVSWTLELCEALEEAHAEGIVHRDIKPSNVFLVARQGERMQVKLVDFGLAKRLDATSEKSVTESGLIVGSPAYMSPEQLRGASATPESDIWGLGVLLYEMLSGARPFQGENSPAVLAAIAADPPIPIQDVVEDVPVGLARVVNKCLRKSPGERFASVGELAKSLERGFTAAPEDRAVDDDWGSETLEIVAPTRPVATARTARIAWLLVAVVGALSLVAATRGAWLAASREEAPRVAEGSAVAPHTSAVDAGLLLEQPSLRMGVSEQSREPAPSSPPRSPPLPAQRSSSEVRAVTRSVTTTPPRGNAAPTAPDLASELAPSSPPPALFTEPDF